MDTKIEHTHDGLGDCGPQAQVDRILAEAQVPPAVGATSAEPTHAAVAGVSSSSGGVTINLPSIYIGVPTVVRNIFTAIGKVPSILLSGMNMIGVVINYGIVFGAMLGGFLYSLTLIFSFFGAYYFRGVDNHDWMLLLQGIIGLFIALSMLYAIRKN